MDAAIAPAARYVVTSTAADVVWIAWPALARPRVTVRGPELVSVDGIAYAVELTCDVGYDGSWGVVDLDPAPALADAQETGALDAAVRDAIDRGLFD